MAKSSVLLIGPLAHTDKEWYALGSKYSLKEFREGNRQDFLSKLKTDFSDIVGLYRSNNSVAQTGPFDAEICNALPKSLKFIAHNGAGYDNIDVDTFTKKGIQISSTPIAVDNATADVGMFLLLGALRQATVPLNAIRAGEWRGKTAVGHDPQGKKLGILGMGGIGRVGAHRFFSLTD
jgi:glyoxylate reductase